MPASAFTGGFSHSCMIPRRFILQFRVEVLIRVRPCCGSAFLEFFCLLFLYPLAAQLPQPLARHAPAPDVTGQTAN